MTEPVPGRVVEMSWDPITRIIGSLGIHTQIDFTSRRVVDCHTTSSIFRGYSVFLRGKDPRDSHFITSRICGVYGDNHATSSVYAQNMAYGVKPPAIAEWIVNLGGAAEYMFDHNLFQDNLVGVDCCEQMVRATNPSLLTRADRTESPHGTAHGYRTIGDLMRALNPFEGALYREALAMSRLTREMFRLMEGRHAHPSTLYPGGVGTVPSIQLFTEYQLRLLRYIDFLKRMLPAHDDLFDFFLEALPGYDAVGRRRTLLACWGSFQVTRRLSEIHPRVRDGIELRDLGVRVRALGYTLAERSANGRFGTTVIVDAVATGAAPGTVQVFDLAAAGARSTPSVVHHAQGLDDVLTIAIALGARLEGAYLLGCEGACFEPDVGGGRCLLAPEVEAAAQRCVGLLGRIIDDPDEELVTRWRV